MPDLTSFSFCLPYNHWSSNLPLNNSIDGIIYSTDRGNRGRRAGRKVKERELNNRNRIETVMQHRPAQKFAYNARDKGANVNNLISLPLYVPVNHKSVNLTTEDLMFDTRPLQHISQSSTVWTDPDHSRCVNVSDVIVHDQEEEHSLKNVNKNSGNCRQPPVSKVKSNIRRKKKSTYASLRTMQLNIQTCSDKHEDRLDEVLQVGTKRNISILALSEFRRRGHDSREVVLEDGTAWDSTRPRENMAWQFA